jgi:hypothetical protein
MNMSRIALLSAVFCATSAFASETPEAVVSTVVNNTVAQPGMISKVTNFVTYPFVTVFNAGDSLAGTIADKLYLNYVIGQITGVSFLKGSCVDKPVAIGKSLVAVAAVYAAYKAYQALNEQNVDNNDDMIFIDEEYEA